MSLWRNTLLPWSTTCLWLLFCVFLLQKTPTPPVLWELFKIQNWYINYGFYRWDLQINWVIFLDRVDSFHLSIRSVRWVEKQLPSLCAIPNDFFQSFRYSYLSGFFVCRCCTLLYLELRLKLRESWCAANDLGGWEASTLTPVLTSRLF